MPSEISPFDGRNRTVIFHHIPKTAGSTLECVLERRYSANEIFNVNRSRGIHEAKFAAMAAEDRARFRLIKGHMDFGIHECVQHPFTYVTMLRHPTERVISHYYYVKKSPNHRLFAQVSSANLSIEEYVSSGITLELNNGHVRSLVGPAHLDVEFGRCSRDMLETARANLRNYFSVVGLTERFDETLLLMRRRLGWAAWPYYRPRNVSRTNPGSRGVSPEAVTLIERHNALDLELYHEVAESFDRMFASQGLSNELRRFRTRNRMYGHWFLSYDVMRYLRRRWEGMSRRGPTVSEHRSESAVHAARIERVSVPPQADTSQSSSPSEVLNAGF